MRDQTANVLVERTLQDSERRWRSLVEASPIGIGLSDERNRLVIANGALCDLLGRPHADVIGRSTSDFAHPDDLIAHPGAGGALADAVRGDASIERRYVRPDGSERWAWLRTTSIPGPDGEPWTLAHVEDVTDRRAVERAVVASERNLAAVAEVIKRIQSGNDARQTIVEAAVALAHAAHGTLLEPAKGIPALVVTATTDPRVDGTVVPLTATSMVVQTFSTGQPIFLPDAGSDPLASPSLLAWRCDSLP